MSLILNAKLLYNGLFSAFIPFSGFILLALLLAGIGTVLNKTKNK